MNSETMTTEQAILEDYRQDALDQVSRVSELMTAAAHNPDKRELAEIGLATELAVQKLRCYFGKSWGHGNDHGSVA